MEENFVEICRFALPIPVNTLVKVVKAIESAYGKVGYSKVCMRGDHMDGREQLVLVSIPPSSGRKQSICLDTVQTRLHRSDVPSPGDPNV